MIDLKYAQNLKRGDLVMVVNYGSMQPCIFLRESNTTLRYYPLSANYVNVLKRGGDKPTVSFVMKDYNPSGKMCRIDINELPKEEQEIYNELKALV